MFYWTLVQKGYALWPGFGLQQCTAVEIVPRSNEITAKAVSPVRKPGRFKNRPDPAGRTRLKVKEQIRSAHW